jgi:hypothetical protein
MGSRVRSGTLLHHLKAQALGDNLTCIAQNHAADNPFMFATGSHDGAFRIWTKPPDDSTPGNGGVSPHTSSFKLDSWIDMDQKTVSHNKILSQKICMRALRTKQAYHSGNKWYSLLLVHPVMFDEGLEIGMYIYFI